MFSWEKSRKLTLWQSLAHSPPSVYPSTMHPNSPPPNRYASLIGGLVLGLVIAAMGSFFCLALMKGFNHARETHSWVETPCQIVNSQVIEHRPTPNSPMSYIPKIEFTYSYEGTDYSGDKIKRVDGPTNHREKADDTVATWPKGKSVCFVNPKDPATAILKQSTRAPGYSMWFPGLFIVGGLGIVVGTIRNHIKRQ